MVERGVMPPSAHEFALEDMEAASGPECALSIRGGEGGWLFFPGCQLAASRGEQVEALYAWLRDALAGQGEFAPGLERGPVSLLLRCCGIPARWGGREELFARQAQELRQQCLPEETLCILNISINPSKDCWTMSARTAK